MKLFISFLLCNKVQASKWLVAMNADVCVCGYGLHVPGYMDFDTDAREYGLTVLVGGFSNYCMTNYHRWGYAMRNGLLLEAFGFGGGWQPLAGSPDP